MSIVKGDNVRCINGFGIWTLQEGHVYKVIDVRDTTIQIVGSHGGANWYRKTRFELIKSQGVAPMQKFNVGDVVVRLSGSGLRVGAEYTVIAVHPNGTAVRFKGEGSSWWCTSTLALISKVPAQQGVLTNEQVFTCLLQGTALEYFFNGQWHTVQNPKSIIVQFIETTQFRKKVDLISVNGYSVVKPIVRSLTRHVVGTAYSISFNKAEVFKAPRRDLDGKPHWLNPQHAQEALVALLEPFKVQPKPLNPTYEEIV